MEADPLVPQVEQPALFEWGETRSGSLEFYPEVWNAVEALVYHDLNARRVGVELLLKLGAHRLSPLVAGMLASRLVEPDLALRGRIVLALAELASVLQGGQAAPDNVRRALAACLARFRTREIYALLEAAAGGETPESAVASLLRLSPYAGNHLADILAERKLPLPVRRQAARMLGRVGFVDSLPALERIAYRLEARQSGQQQLPFLPASGLDETVLLPDVREALAALRSP